MAVFLRTCVAGLLLMAALAAPGAARELVVAHDTHFMPFEFPGPNGVYTGFDIQLWQHLAKIAGISYVFRPMDFNTILPGLESGKADVGMAGISITPDRAKNVLFSDPYYQSGLMILVRIDDKDIADAGDLSGKVVAVKSGTSSLAFVEKLGKVRQIKEFVNNDGMFSSF